LSPLPKYSRPKQNGRKYQEDFNEKGISDHSHPAAVSGLGCCSDRFIIIVKFKFTGAQQQHVTIDEFGLPVNHSKQWVSANHLAVEHFSFEPDTGKFNNNHNESNDTDFYFFRGRKSDN
jgi:hypothetical protein